MSVPLEDYALLGDCRSAALVSKGGSIDWLCWPRFDSPACFAALLGTPEHGRWSIAPCAAVRRVTRRYRGETLVLETLLETEGGDVLLTDCMAMPRHDTDAPQLVRLVEGRRGRVPMRMEWIIRFHYGSVVPWVTREDGLLRAIAGPDAVRLYSHVPTRGEGFKTIAEFEACQGERVAFRMTYTPSHLSAAPPGEAEHSVHRAESVWSEWSHRSHYSGAYRADVQRSLLTLKALTFEPTGGIVAAPTTSLPERIGGSRNWDYRFCWIRDATITLYALLVTGHSEEAVAWRGWLLRAVAGSPSQTQILYGLSGERQGAETELDWLPGYENSKPVRAGNAAHAQVQLDTFGELMDAMYQCRHNGLDSEDSWQLEKALLGHLEQVWRDPGEGIWEIRGRQRQFTHSKVMVWVAFDRAVRSIEQFGLDGPLERWRALRDEIHRQVCEQGYSTKTGTFTQTYGGTELDASLLLIPLVGFLPPEDPRIVATVLAVERELLIDDTFMLRYQADTSLDGLPPGEGAFLACSFWLVSARVMHGRVAEARALFERLLSVRNDVGLMAEEYEPRAGRMVGNFPQAFSHLALVDAAVSLSNEGANPAEHRVTPANTTQSGGKSTRLA